MMRVVFLSSAYFGYVHTYTFDTAYSDPAAPEQPAPSTPVVDTKTLGLAKPGDPLLARLAAWVCELTKENAPC
jgi:hypothetical protein